MSDDKNKQNLILSDERAVLLDHDYDGIQELDFPLPQWWLMVFYGTIVFAIIYAGYYMVGPGPTLAQELAQSLTEISARAPKQNPARSAGNELLALLGKPEHIQAGAKVFTEKCAACHGVQGQGQIGPNLTDDFWIHGNGSAADIAKVVNDGVTEKGMPPWGMVLKPDELNDVVVFVKSIRGSNPAGAKEPQGTQQAVQNEGTNGT